MTFHRTVFDTYEVIALRNVYLDYDSVVEAIEMISVVVKIMVKERQIKQIHIKDFLFFYFLCAHVTNKFSLDEKIVVEWVECEFQPK